MMTWAIISAGDQQFWAGRAFQYCAGTESEVRSSRRAAPSSLSRMGSSVGTKTKSKLHAATASALERRAARLLKRVSQLQDARFAERRTENLESDRELTANFSAGHRDSRHARQ